MAATGLCLGVALLLAAPAPGAHTSDPTETPEEIGEAAEPVSPMTKNTAARTGTEAVVVLHGLGRSWLSMRSLASRLGRAGYQVHNLDYPSTRRSPAELVAEIASRVEACCREAETVHFVTHSLGGVLVRAYLAEHEIARLGRVVMLAPPNHGSELVDTLGDTSLLRFALGPTAPELGTHAASLPNRLPEPHYEVGIIAGDRSVNPLGSAVIGVPSDGTVSIESAKLAGMKDFLQVPYSHTFIMRADEVAQQTIHFLRNGRFSHGE